MSKHSAAPWKISEWIARDSDGAVEGGGNQVVDANGHMISACTVEGSSDTEEADLRLIASAPDLLAALQELLTAADNLDPQSGAPIGYQRLLDAVSAADAVIIKATGEPA